MNDPLTRNGIAPSVEVLLNWFDVGRGHLNIRIATSYGLNWIVKSTMNIAYNLTIDMLTLDIDDAKSLQDFVNS